MNAYLREAKRLLALSEPLLFVIGNESCDLDSAVCAISLAYFHAKVGIRTSDYRDQYNVMPLLNIPRTNLPLKTEVTHFLKRNCIELENIICSDEVSPQTLRSSKIILVDHHIAAATIHADNIEAIIDHRPVTKALPATAKCSISDVGSCATLIADLILSSECSNECADVIKLLYGPIVLDTVNFSAEADKVRPLDVAVNERIEHILGYDESHRNQLFCELVAARNDVSTLDSLQILSKDLKVVTNRAGTLTVAMPGFPILVQEYMRKPNVDRNLENFAANCKCDVILLMGMQITPDNSVQRDLGIIPLHSAEMAGRITQALTECAQPDLQLAPLETFTGGRFFNQINIRASRKQILPIVQNILDKFE